jgi:hypothetical protein
MELRIKVEEGFWENFDPFYNQFQKKLFETDSVPLD